MIPDDQPPIDPAANRNPFRGVSWRMNNYKGIGVWRLTVGNRGKMWQREFGCPYEAAAVYDVAASIAHGPDAKRNFPGPDNPPRPPIGWTRAGIRQKLYDLGLI